jgi:hypothetical protein
MTTVTSPPRAREQPRRAGARGWVDEARARPLAVSLAVLGLLMLAAAVNLYRKGLGLTFNYDEWNWVMNRRGWSAATLLNPHNEHLSLIPVLIFKLLFATVGIDAYWPYRVVVIVAHLTCVALIFVLARRRLGDVFALALAALILFVGSAWEDLLWPFQVGYLGSVAFGLGMFVALDRRDRTGDILASVLLALSIASASVGLPFAGAALVEVVLRRREPWNSSGRWRDAWIVGIPVGLYLIWFAIYGNPNAAPGNVHGFALVRENGPAVPSYTADMASNAFAGLFGLAIDWGRPLVVGALAIGIWWSLRRGQTTRLFALIAALALFWGLTALFRAQLGDAGSSRYIYPGAVLIVLLAAELFRGARATVRAAVVAAIVVLFAAVANYGPLKAGSAHLQDWSSYVRPELGALQIAGPTAPPTLAPDPVRAPDITAAKYFPAERQLGSPADTPAEMRVRGEPQREAADGVLIAGLQVGLRPTRAEVSSRGAAPPLESSGGAATTRSGGCVSLRATAPGAFAVITVPRAGLAVANTGAGNAEVRIRSFGDNFPAAPLGSVAPGQAALLAIPPRAGIIWHAQVTVPGTARVCARR